MPMLHRLALLLLLAPVMASAQTRVVNAPLLRYTAVVGEREIAANVLTLDVERERLPSQLTLRVPPTSLAVDDAHCDGARAIAAPVAAETVAAAPPSASLDPAAALLVMLAAPGSDRDPAARDTVAIDVAIGNLHRTVVLTETAANSGVFAGALPSTGAGAALAACVQPWPRGAAATLNFAGDAGSLPTGLTPPIDPANLVFDATSGALVDGVGVTLANEDGTPATVFGDDGISRYPSMVTSGAATVDAGGHAYPAMPGRYRFPRVPAGRYRLIVSPPAGYVAPSTAKGDALAGLRDSAGAPFLLNAASQGGLLVLTAAAPFAADVPVDRVATASLLLTRTLSVRDASPGDRIEARLTLTNRGKTASGTLRLVDHLPPGLRYLAGSMRGATEAANDGRSIEASLASLAPGATVELRYVLAVTPGAPPGEATAQAQAQGPLAISNRAAAAVRIRPLLFTDAVTVIGQVAEGGCGAAPRGVGGIRLLMEDGTVAVTDRDGFYHLEGVGVGRHVLALDAASLPAGVEPVDCERSTASAGSATSRFVEGAGGVMRRVDFRLRRTVAAAAVPAIALSDDAAAAGDRDWLAGRAPGIAWLFPAADYNPRAPVTRVVIQHAPGQRVALTLGGKPVDPLDFDATDTDGHGVAISRWVGVALVAGDNRLTARVLAADGHLVASLDRVVTVSGPPARAVLDAAHSRLVADGATPPLVALRITDAGGRPVRAGTLAPFTIAAPYAAALDPHGRAVASVPVIGDDGIALAPLQPTGQAGAVAIHVAFPIGATVRSSAVEAWLTPAVRGWTVVGFGAGSLGFDTLTRHARALTPGERDRRIVDGQLAFYAKGRIRGAWLLTIAYDSARRADPDRGLLGQIDPGRYYTVYGDGAVQGQDAASARRLYLRLETRQAYALFGDIETGFGDAQLTRYARTVTGLKAAYRGERWRATGFAADVATLAAHDEIQGNGLSGPYRLRARGIVANSDTVRLEIRDRYRSERIVSATPLARHLDYEIDDDAGTLRFREPVASRDAGLNPRFIVADYEVAGGGAARLAAGGRIEHRAGALIVGASAVHDETRTGAAGVAGADARLQMTPDTVAKAEVAGGGDRGLAQGGGAFAAEVEHHAPGLDLTAYARQQAAGFGLSQQNLVEAGTRKLGADLRWTAGEFAIVGAGWYQAMLAGPGERIAGQLRIDWRHGPRTLFAGAEVASDHGLDGGDRDSRLVSVGVSEALAGGALTLTGETQVALGGAKASVDFPVRHQIEAAWRLSPALRLIGGYEIDDGATYRARTAQLGVDLTPWHGGRLSTTLNDRGEAEQGRRFAQYSIAQSLPLGARMTLSATLDAATTLAGSAIPATATVAAFQPVAAAGALGQDAGDYRAATLAAAWRDGAWSARARVEDRRGASDTRWTLLGDVVRTLGEGRTLAMSARTYRVTDAAGTTAASTSADVALAWRPPSSRWAVLDRLTLRHDRGDPIASADNGTTLGTSTVVATADQLTTRLIDNIAIDYRTALDGRGRGLEASVYYGIKYVAGRYGDEGIDGLIDATGMALRHGLGPHLDVGLAAAIQHAWSDHRLAWSGGPSLGLSPAGDLWMTLGYNLAGYRDRDLSVDRYTQRGPYLTMRLKFDAQAVGRAAQMLGPRR